MTKKTTKTTKASFKQFKTAFEQAFLWSESYCQMLCMEASGGDLILPDSVNEFHISDDFTQAAVAL